MANITLTFQPAFQQRLQRFLAEQPITVDTIVFKVATEVLGDIVLHWPVDEGVSRAAWAGPTQRGPGHWQLSNPMPYAAVIEYGGYPGVGPKTAPGGGFPLPGGLEVGGGIFPTQKPEAPVRRALSAHHQDIPKMVEAAHRQQWGR